MARRRNVRSGKNNTAILLLILIGVLAFILIQIVTSILFLIVAGSVLILYVSNRYAKWQAQRIKNYNSWQDLYKQEIRPKLFLGAALTVLCVGIITLFYRAGVGIVIIAISLIFLPNVDLLLQKSFNRFTIVVRSALVLALIIIGYSINRDYKLDQEEQVRKYQLAEKKRREERVLKEKDIALKRDSSDYYLSSATPLIQHKRYKQALALLDKSITLNESNDKALITRGNILKSLGDYDQAMKSFGRVNSSEAFINIGRCLLNKGEKQNAIFYFKKASDRGSTDGLTLYNKYNPVVKKIIGYVTRCCDGSTSDAKGRGACSHHGGVCDWSDPIYSEERVYGD